MTHHILSTGTHQHLNPDPGSSPGSRCLERPPNVGRADEHWPSQRALAACARVPWDNGLVDGGLEVLDGNGGCNSLGRLQ